MARKKQKLSETSDATSATASSSTQQSRPATTSASAASSSQQEAAPPATQPAGERSAVGIESLPNELLGIIFEQVSDMDLVSLSCASPDLHRGLLHEDGSVWISRASVAPADACAALQRDILLANATEKQQCLLVGGRACRYCRKRLAGTSTSRKRPGLQTCALCARRHGWDGPDRLPKGLATIEEAMAHFDLTSEQVDSVPVHQFVTQWSEDGPKSHIVDQRGRRRELQAEEVDMFVLDRPADGSSAIQTFRRVEDLSNVWYRSLAARHDQESKKQLAAVFRARRTSLTNAGLSLSTVRDDPVAQAFIRGEWFCLQPAGIDDEAAVIAELVIRREQSRLGVPLPSMVMQRRGTGLHSQAASMALETTSDEESSDEDDSDW